ncbi:lipid-A-disaccharide synthase [Omnitrophica bacterium]|nr:lipid-A-disaccharide synthase [Candidatus Omnitrophota bacterium]
MSKKILIIAGESSGDLYGAHLVSAIKDKHPGAIFSGIGGSRMKDAGVEILYPIDELAIIGVTEILSKIKVIQKAFLLLKKKVDEEKIDLAILVNYPGFNLRFAKVLKAKNIPVVFYSSPQVWAWGRWRLRNIKRFVDKMIVFFKFEEDFYRRNGIEAEFVGHPLIDIVKLKAGDAGIKNNVSSKTVSLAPGSRRSEINNLLATMLEAARIMHSENKDIRFIITKHAQLPPEIYLEKIQKYKLPLTLVDGKTYDCLAASDLAIVVSGSITLEAMILKMPMIIVNKTSVVNGLLYLLFVRLANIGLVNIIAGKRIVPELLQYNATPRNIANEAMDILTDRERYKKMKRELESVNKLVGPPGASERAATLISSLLGQG